MTRMIAAALFLCSLSLAGNELEFETERVVVFKDGFCLVIKKATGEADENGELYTENVPDAAVLGSFWAVPDKDRILSMTAGVVTTEEEKKVEAPCVQYLHVLRANRGKACILELDDRTNLRGTIGEVLVEERFQPAPQPFSWPGQPRPNRHALVSHLSGQLFVFRMGEEDVLLPVHRIRRLTIDGMKVTEERTVKETRSVKRITFRVAGGAGKRSFTLMYFRPGVRWIPTYRVGLAAEGAEEKVARIALQAEILNEAEDFRDVPFDLVVGVPHFRFRDVVSPFVLEKTLQRTLQQSAPQIMGQLSQASNVHFGARGTEWRQPQPESREVELPAELTAGASHDLFVYSLDKLTLPKGHRAAVPVFETEAPYRDLYTWELKLSRHDVETAPTGTRPESPLNLSQNRVWHLVELKNGTKVPWTTGPAMLLLGRQPLAQELMTYTPPGGTVRVPVTVAVDVRGEFGEEETGRQLKALKWMRYDYARIDKRGTLEITNFKSRAIDVEVTCHLGGHADKADPDAKITIGPFDQTDWKNYRGHPAVNNHSVVFWRLRLEPGKMLKPTVDYHYFTRH